MEGEVAADKAALHTLAFDAVFDDVMCVDAVDFVCPEDWPAVLDESATRRGPTIRSPETPPVIQGNPFRRPRERSAAECNSASSGLSGRSSICRAYAVGPFVPPQTFCWRRRNECRRD